MFSESVTFCPVPWIHSSTNSVGDLRVCCVCNVPPFSNLIDERGRRLNAANSLLPRNHPLYKEMRLSILTNKKHPLCKQCWDRERVGLLSQRKTSEEKFFPDVKEKAIKLTKEDGSIREKDFPIRYYDLRLGNKCNCRCIMCNKEDSSMWNRDEKITDWSGNLDTPYLNNLIDDLKHVRRFYLTGGEATVNDNHWKLVDIILNRGHHKHITLDYNTNGVFLTKGMLEIWGKFQCIGIAFSIDGIGKVFEQIRTPAKWDVVKDNLLLFEKESYPNTYAGFAITASSINILNIIDLFKWYSQQGFKKIHLVPHFNILQHPVRLDIMRMDLEQKKEIIKDYEEFYKWIDDNLSLEDASKCKAPFKGMINMMMGNENEN